MGEKTQIRWADASDNPIRVKHPETGGFGGFYCVKISPGCTNCYAAREVARGRWGEPIQYVAGPNAPELYLEASILDGWAKKTKSKLRFVSSMTDICGEFVPDSWYWKILSAEKLAGQQTFLNLTKRSERMEYLTVRWMDGFGAPANMWMGFSAENQEWFDKRWPYILGLAEAYGFIVWVSIEPMIGPVILPNNFLALGKKAWVVVGGESGPGARVMDPQWARALRDQCTESGVPFFFKQWGQFIHTSQMLPGIHYNEAERRPTGDHFARCTSKEWAGFLLDEREWSQFPG